MPLPAAVYELPSALRREYGYHCKQSLDATFRELYEADQSFALGYLCGPARTTEERIRLTQQMAAYSANVFEPSERPGVGYVCKMDEPDADFTYLIENMSPEGASDPAYTAAFLMAIHQDNVFPHSDQAPLIKNRLVQAFAIHDSIIEKCINNYIQKRDASLISHLSVNPMLNQKQKDRLNDFVFDAIFNRDDAASSDRNLLAWIKSEHCSKSLIDGCIKLCISHSMNNDVINVYQAICDSIQCDTKIYSMLPRLSSEDDRPGSTYFMESVNGHAVRIDNDKKLLKHLKDSSIDVMGFVTSQIESENLTYRQTKIIYELAKKIEDKNLVANVIFAMNQFTEQRKLIALPELMAAYVEIADGVKSDGCHWVEKNINLATKYAVIGMQSCITHGTFNNYAADTQAKMKGYVNFVNALQSIGIKWTETVDFNNHKTSLIEVLESDQGNVDAIEIATSIRLKEKLNQMLPMSQAIRNKRNASL
ncbi:hypothetical protein ACEUAI_12835 [Aeromonas veronii]